MISYLKGTVKSCEKQSIVFAIGPIGLEIFVPNGKIFQVEEKRDIYLHMHWNQEQGPTLYGFLSALEKSVFVLIIGCSGIGPKIALSVLADLGAQGFIEAIQTGDERLLSKVNGIGLKKAEQIIVQLKHKIMTLFESGIVLEGSTRIEQWQTVTEALQALNYSRVEINHAMNYLKNKGIQSEASFDQLLRQALSFLSK